MQTYVVNKLRDFHAKISLVIVVCGISNMDELSIIDYRVIKIGVHLIIHIHWWLNLFKSRTTYFLVFVK